MNINVQHSRAVQGLMGVIAPGNWLPVLADGRLLGARPADAAQRFDDLYRTFADSWRVNARSSLFDYEAGLTPSSFVVDGWPVAQPQGCVAPPQPAGPSANVVPTAIGDVEATRLCQGIVDSERQRNCIQDVMATGERGFAATYLATEKLEQRPAPLPPVLVAPADNSRLPAAQVRFEWQQPTNGVELVGYRHCLWHADELFDLNRCAQLEVNRGGLLDALAKRVAGLPRVLWLLLIVALVITALLVLIRYGRKAWVWAFFLLLLALSLWLLGNRRLPELPRSTDVSALRPNKVYFWKVVAETTEGVVVESKTRRLEVTP